MIATQITTTAALELYWLGRYVQRAMTIAKETIGSFDVMIDDDPQDGQKLFAKLGVQTSEDKPEALLAFALYGEHSSSIASCLLRAKESAVRCRSLISADSFMFLNTAYIQIEAMREDPSAYELERTLDRVYGFLGTLHAALIESLPILFIEFGLIVERCDLFVRLYDDLTPLLLDIKRLNIHARAIDERFEKIKITSSDTQKLLGMINSAIDRLVSVG